MEGYVSARENIAGLIDGNQAWFFYANRQEPQRVETQVVKQVFANCNDRIYLKNTTKKKLLNELNTRSMRDDGLMLFLTFLDQHSNDDTRKMAAPVLESFIEDDDISKYLKNILYSRPLPGQDLAESRQFKFLGNGKFPLLNNFLTELVGAQSIVGELYDVFRSELTQSTMDKSQSEYTEGVFTNLGVFALLASIQDADLGTGEKDKCQYSCLSRLKELPNGRQIVSSVFSLVGKDNAEHAQKSGVGGSESEAGVEYKNRIRTGIVPHDVYQGVKSQIERIEKDVSSGNHEQAMRFADQLIREQVERDETSYAVMSLCNLSEKAKSLGQVSLQLHWAIKAIELDPADARSQAQVGDALIATEDLDGAMKAFQKCAELGEVEYGMTGVARVYRLLYRFHDAIAVLDDLESRGNETRESTFLRASLLRDLGRYQPALSVYEKYAQDFPEESRGICGLAGTYADLGDYPQAEELYRKAITFYPNAHVPISGLGFILVKQGKFKQGIKLLRNAIDICVSGDNIPYYSLLTALRWQGKYAEVDRICKKFIAKQTHEPEWQLLLIHSLIDRRDIDGALDEVAKAEKLFPAALKLTRFKAFAFRRQGKFEEALGALDYLKAERPYWLEILVDRANLLKQMRCYDEAKLQLDSVLEINPYSRAAQSSMSILSFFLGRVRLDIDQSAVDGLVSVSDWANFYNKGLVHLASGDPRVAKSYFLRGTKHCPFAGIKSDFDVAVSVARTVLKQTGTALKTVKNPVDAAGKIQKAVLVGELGRSSETDKILDQLNAKKTDFDNVIDLVRKRYSESSLIDARARPNLEVIMNSQVEHLLLAA